MAVKQEYDKLRNNGKAVDFERVANSKSFKKLLDDRKRFIVPLTIFFLIFYFLLPILTSYTTFLNTPAIGDISWVWIFAISQFAMTWILCTIYVKKANTFDEQAEQIVEEITAIGDISWVWIFAISQFAMTWILCTIYVKKANTFDEQAEQIVEEINRGGDSE